MALWGVLGGLGGGSLTGSWGGESFLAMDMVWSESICHGFTVVNLKFPTVGLWEISLIWGYECRLGSLLADLGSLCGSSKMSWVRKTIEKPTKNIGKSTFFSKVSKFVYRVSKTQRFLIVFGGVNFCIDIKCSPLSRRLLIFLTI